MKLVRYMDTLADLADKFDKNMRPLLDAVDRLRNLKVTSEGIPLPTIVVVGDQSSGKSSVLESLATISLPRGQGIATRVPLVLRLQSCRVEQSSIVISYKDQSFSIKEADINAAVDRATNDLAGNGKGVTNTPISLHIRKPNAPDLTMIDLPGITRVPVHGQPENIYEQIAAMIRHYIKPKETVILNVLSATVDFSTCESIRMSQQEDKRGERTLAVVTKVDRSLESVYEKVTADYVNIGLGYICVRNRTDDDASHEEARKKETALFETHPSLSQLDKGCVGIAALAERLTQIRSSEHHPIEFARYASNVLPGIERQIDKALVERQKELDNFTRSLHSEGDPTDMFLSIVDEQKTLTQDLMLNGNYERFADDNKMHWPARLDEMFQQFSIDLNDLLEGILLPSKTEEIVQRTSEMKGLYLPNFLSPVIMKTLVGEEIEKASHFCTNLVMQTHEYVLRSCLRLLTTRQIPFQIYKPPIRRWRQFVSKHVMAHACMNFVKRVIEKERSSVFTLNDGYMSSVRKIQERFQALKCTDSNSEPGDVYIEGFAQTFNVQEPCNKSDEYQAAWEMKVVHKRMADEICLEIRHSLECAILKGLRNGVLKAKMGQDMSNLMVEHAATLQKKTTLRKRVEDLKESKAVVQKLF